MKEQNFILKNVTSFSLTDIFECGQCFRWLLQPDGSYLGIFKQNVVHIKKVKNDIYISGTSDNDLHEEITFYFDLARDYETLKKELSQKDTYLSQSIQHGQGIRILNQDLWECIISFIISANNNIPRIKGIIERLAQAYGTPITWQCQTFYTFPTPEQLQDVTIEDFRKLGLGFRDKRIYETTHMVLDKQIDLAKLSCEANTHLVKEQLLRLSGVGPKVADCILLFSTLKRWDVFPVDVWVRRVMNDLYIHNPDETKVTQKQIQQLAYKKFGMLSGLAQQYLFYWRRSA